MMETHVEPCWPDPLVQRLALHARARPDRPALIFPSPTGATVVLGWRELFETVRKLGAHLACAGVAPGEAVAVLSSSQREQILGFLAVLACGGVPTILSHPSIKQSAAQFLDTFRHVLSSGGIGWLLHGSDGVGNIRGESQSGGAPAARSIEFPDVASLTERAEPRPMVPDRPMFLQFSSGTTGLRKGIAISGAAYQAHVSAYSTLLELRPDRDVVASWLPLYHDMGLIAAFLVQIDCGVTSVHISPFDWLSRPVWLFRLATHHRATFLWMPNFAFQLCAARISSDDLAHDVDLRDVRGFISAGEPVRDLALTSFCARMAPVGVRPDQLQVSYGMAENVFAITQTPLGREPVLDVVEREPLQRARLAMIAAPGKTTITYVSCGQAIAGTSVRISGTTVERVVGEIEIKGDSLFDGYWRRDRSVDQDGWFATGDLGYLADGELYVTGRAKDLIIHNGVNLPPNEIEEVIEQVAGVKVGRVVVFGVFNEGAGTEDVVAMLEVTDDAPCARDVKRAVREQVQLQLGLSLSEVAVWGPGALAKSTSGKLSRARNRELLLEHRASLATQRAEEAPAGPTSPTEARLVQLWEAALAGRYPGQRIGIRDLLFSELGADSLAAMEVLAGIQTHLGRDLSPALLFQHETIEAQASLIQGRAKPSPLLVTMRRGQAGRSLFLVHDASGDTLSYLPLARHIPNGWSIHALQNPHAFGRDGMYDSVQSMAADYLRALQTVQPTGPYYLGGHSCGGTIAYELASQLERAGQTVGAVILIDSFPPRSPNLFDGRVVLERCRSRIQEQLAEPPHRRTHTKIRGLLDRRPEIQLLDLVYLFEDLGTLCDAIELCLPEAAGEPSVRFPSVEDRWRSLYGRLTPLLVEWAWRPRLYRDKTRAALRRASVVARSLVILTDYRPARPMEAPVVLIKAADSDQSLGWDEHTVWPMTVHAVEVVDLPAAGTSHTHIITGRNALAVGRTIAAALEAAP